MLGTSLASTRRCSVAVTRGVAGPSVRLQKCALSAGLMSTAGFALKDSQSCQGSLGAFQEFLDLGPMELGRDSTDLEASDQMGQMDKAGSQVCLEWAQEVQALELPL